MPAADIDISSSRVLIADDIPQNRELLEACLADEGYEILMAGNGSEAMEMVQHHQPDLILLDIMMPRMSGYEVCAQLKQEMVRWMNNQFLCLTLKIGLGENGCRNQHKKNK